MPLDRRAFLHHAALALGGALSASCRAAGLARSSGPMPGSGRTLLSARQRRCAEALVDRILPATETPGALEVGVADFFDFMLAEGYERSQVEIVLAGLARLDALAAERHGRGFAALGPETQDAILREIEAEELAASPAPSGSLFPVPGDRPFFAVAREVTLVGYFTSKPVVTGQFDYRPTPGRFDGCAERAPDERPFYAVPR